MMPDGAADFDALVGRTAKVVIVAGSDYDPRRRKNNVVLAKEKGPAALHALRTALRLDPAAEGMHWMTPGEPTLAMYDAGGDLLMTVTCVLPNFVRSRVMDSDARLADPALLSAWLTERGALPQRRARGDASGCPPEPAADP
jgi:hypothetical protein